MQGGEKEEKTINRNGILPPITEVCFWVTTMQAFRITSSGTNTVIFMEATQRIFSLGSLSFYPLPNKVVEFIWWPWALWLWGTWILSLWIFIEVTHCGPTKKLLLWLWKLRAASLLNGGQWSLTFPFEGRATSPSYGAVLASRFKLLFKIHLNS